MPKVTGVPQTNRKVPCDQTDHKGGTVGLSHPILSIREPGFSRLEEAGGRYNLSVRRTPEKQGFARCPKHSRVLSLQSSSHSGKGPWAHIANLYLVGKSKKDRVAAQPSAGGHSWPARLESPWWQDLCLILSVFCI